MVSMLDLERFRATPLTREPFEFLIVPEFVKADARSAIHNDYPEVDRPGSFPLGEVSYGSAFAKLVEQMRSEEFRNAFEEKFGIDLTNRPDMITVRGRCSEKDGKIHTDSETKIITILIYMNAGWESAGGRLRLLRSGNNLDDMILEVPPTEGTLLAFRRSNNSWHGHKPFSGPRRVIQFNWVTSEAVVRREQNRHRFSAWMKKIRGALIGREKGGVGIEARVASHEERWRRDALVAYEPAWLAPQKESGPRAGRLQAIFPLYRNREPQANRKPWPLLVALRNFTSGITRADLSFAN